MDTIRKHCSSYAEAIRYDEAALGEILQTLTSLPLYIYDNGAESIWRPLFPAPVGDASSRKSRKMNNVENRDKITSTKPIGIDSLAHMSFS